MKKVMQAAAALAAAGAAVGGAALGIFQYAFARNKKHQDWKVTKIIYPQTI